MGINFEQELNKAQLEAVMHTDGPVLVIAGAGSGKTRTIVYRLARMVEEGIPPESILLMTFTRKAAQEMLLRAGTILDRPLAGVQGGTFHSFAFATLRRFSAAQGFSSGFTLLDRADSESIFKDVRESNKLGKGDRSFPKKATVCDLVTKSRNKEMTLEAVLEAEAFHLSPYQDDIETIAKGYEEFKQSHALMDYDDLLFHFDRLLREQPEIRDLLRQRHRYLMVDEYQDTNLVQARIVEQLAGEEGNVMAVGDDAQSIYAFRGANVANILEFPKRFKGTKLIRLERNYRSTQPILDLTNSILENALIKFDKKLYTESKEGDLPRVVKPISDQTQAKQVVDEVIQLSRKYPLHEIAVLFRAGFQSFPVEVALGRVGLSYKKYGGIRFSEAAHVKDVLSYLKVLVNPADAIAWHRLMAPIKGIGPKTAKNILDARLSGDEKKLEKFLKKYPDLKELMEHLDHWRQTLVLPSAILEQVMKHYEPVLRQLFPDDYPKRQAGLEQLGQMASNYRDMEQFLADMNLDGDANNDEEHERNTLVLSTIHSAKGLEWKAVIIIDLVEERFPSKRAMGRPEDLEEERRLMYVACTRAKEHLSLFVPSTVYNRYNGTSEPTIASPFIMELPRAYYATLEESYSGSLMTQRATAGTTSQSSYSGSYSGSSGASSSRSGSGSSESANTTSPFASRSSTSTSTTPEKLGFCEHKIFGKGKIVAFLPPNKYRVNFPGFGLKVIVGDYLTML